MGRLNKLGREQEGEEVIDQMVGCFFTAPCLKGCEMDIIVAAR